MTSTRAAADTTGNGAPRARAAAVLFDLDGVLVDSLRVVEQAGGLAPSTRRSTPPFWMTAGGTGRNGERRTGR